MVQKVNMPSTYITSLHSETVRHDTDPANARVSIAPAGFNPSCSQLPMGVGQAQRNRMQRLKFYVEIFMVADIFA